MQRIDAKSRVYTYTVERKVSRVRGVSIKPTDSLDYKRVREREMDFLRIHDASDLVCFVGEN